MTKSHISQENNLNSHILPFYESWKSTLLAQAKLYNLPDINEKTELSVICDTIQEYQNEQIELSKRTAELPIEHSTYASFTENDKLRIIEKAEIYHIPHDSNNVNYRQLAYDIDDYELMLDQAGDKLLDWDTSTYDPVGLQQAINDYDSNAKQEQVVEDWRWYVSGIKQVYNISRGV